jgi:hypothetical protein
MNEEMRLHNVEVDAENVPHPRDREAETAETIRIANAAIAGDDPDVKSEHSTAWIAQQLGSLSESLSGQGRHGAATRVAHAAIDVAIAVNDVERFQANNNTLGNALGRAGDFDAAAEAYRDVLDAPALGSGLERTMAHLALAQIYARKAEPKRAVYHFERGVGVLRNYDRIAIEGIIERLRMPFVICAVSALAPTRSSRLRLKSST